MANENSIDVYHALMALEEKVTGVAPDPENVTTDVALALADIFRTDAPMAQETAIVNAIDTITANYGGGGGVDVGAPWREVIGLEAAPSVGDVLPSQHDTITADYVMIGNTIVAGSAVILAAGTTFVLTDEDVRPTLLLLTTNGIQDNEKVTAVEDISSTVSIIEIPDVSDSCVTFTMPDNPASTKRLAIVWSD